MNADPDVTPLVESWLREGPPKPPRLREAVLEAVAQTPQRRHRWWPFDLRAAAPAAKLATAAAIVALFGGYIIMSAFRPGASEVSAPAAVSASPSPSVPAQAPATEAAPFAPVDDLPWPEVGRSDGLLWEPWDEPGTWNVLSEPHAYFPGATEMAIGPDGGPWSWEPGGCGDLMSGEEVACVWQLGRPGYSAFPPPDSYWLEDLAVTSDGTLWAGTGRGLQSYDGEDWTLRSGPSDLGALAVAADDSVWGFGGGDGSLAVVHFSGEDGLAQPIAQPIPDYGPEAPLVPLAAVATADGDVWVGGGLMGSWSFLDDTRGFLVRSDGETWEAMRPLGEDSDPGVVALAADPAGDVWALMRTATESEGGEPHLARFDGQEWTLYSAGDGLPANIGGSLAVDPEGFVWMTLRVDLEEGDVADGAVVSFDGQTWTRYLVGMAARDLVIAPDGTVLVSAEYPAKGHNVVAIRPHAEVAIPED